MRIKLESVSISEKDYDKALKFYTEILGFVKKKDIPFGDARLITVVSTNEPDGAELLLEPNAEYPPMKALKESLKKDGIAFTAFEVDNVYEEYERLQKLGVTFTMAPTDIGIEIEAIFDDTCGNLIMIYEQVDKVKQTRNAAIIPTLRYQNAQSAIEWLCRVFGFEKHLVVQGENDTIAHAQLTFGEAMIMLGSANNDDYGGRGYACRDPEGYLWNFGSYNPWNESE